MTSVLARDMPLVHHRPRRCLPLLAAALVRLSSPAQSAPPPSSPESSLAAAQQNALVDPFDRVLFNSPASNHYFNGQPPPAAPEYRFFPPAPPPLEADLRDLPPLPSGIPAPPELAGFAGELFYPVLGARLAAGDLPGALRVRLQTYRAERTALVDELRSEISATKEIDPGDRDRRLAALAAQQAPRLIALENTAELIRVALQPSSWPDFGPGAADWSENSYWLRQAGRDAPTTADGLRQEARATRSAAFFQDGLSPAERRLLGEAAIELDSLVEAATAAARPLPDSWLFSFSPDPVRLRLSASLPAPLAQKVSDYSSRKVALRTELRGALCQSAGATRAARAAALRALAVIQAPRFASLETAAEDIRKDLAAQPDPPGPPAPPALPPDLTARISVYRRHKVELIKTLYALIAGLPDTGEQGGTPAGIPADGTATWLHDGTTPTGLAPARLRVPVSEFNRRQGELVAALNQELAGIREALARYVRTTNGPADRKSINDLLRDFEQARKEQETWNKYRDYQAAALLPGLSPEQRRLLLGYAIERLTLPLPAGERLE